MATKNIEMYSQKQYELDEIKDRIVSHFDQLMRDVVSLKQVVVRELGESNTLLLVFEKRCTHYIRFVPISYAVCLMIQLSEFQGYQSADIIASGGRGILPPNYNEEDLANLGIAALKNVGFIGKDI